VATEEGKSVRGAVGSVPSASPEDFAASLKRRGEAAQGLERDLLTQVPLLYGSPGSMEPEGDPGILLARIHQEELQRRNGGGVFSSSRTRSDVELPFERTISMLAVLIFLWILFESLG
jgi:hypothetical protein